MRFRALVWLRKTHSWIFGSAFFGKEKPSLSSLIYTVSVFVAKGSLTRKLGRKFDHGLWQSLFSAASIVSLRGLGSHFCPGLSLSRDSFAICMMDDHLQGSSLSSFRWMPLKSEGRPGMAHAYNCSHCESRVRISVPTSPRELHCDCGGPPTPLVGKGESLFNARWLGSVV